MMLNRPIRSKLAILPRVGLLASVGLLLGACDVGWFFDAPVDDAEQQPSPTATATATRRATPTRTPTVTPRATRTPAATATPTPTRTPTPTPTPTRVTGLATLLPNESDLPGDLVLDAEDGDLTPQEVAAESDDPTAYLNRLAGWRYRGGATRQFSVHDPGIGEFFSDLLGVQATVLEFGSAGAAREAMLFQRDYALRQEGWDLDDKSIAAIGDSSAALEGTAEYEGMTVRAAVVFVQQGTRLYRFVGISGAADHFDTTVEIARDAVR